MAAAASLSNGAPAVAKGVAERGQFTAYCPAALACLAPTLPCFAVVVLTELALLP
jgi:hypothetical protein